MCLKFFVLFCKQDSKLNNKGSVSTENKSCEKIRFTESVSHNKGKLFAQVLFTDGLYLVFELIIKLNVVCMICLQIDAIG